MIHGHYVTYTVHQCRCLLCVDAWRIYLELQRIKQEGKAA